MPMVRRVGRPGLIGLAARTAVVSGTASAVQGRAAQRQMAHAQQQQLEFETAKAEIAAPAPAATVASGGADLVAELNTLAALHQNGVLSDDEFAAAKAKLLG